MKTRIKILALFLAVTFSLSAQQKLNKTSQTIKTSKTVTIDLNSSHTNIEIDTWNKDYIEVEAFIESETLSQEQLQDALEDWGLEVSGTKDLVKIKSHGASGIWTSDMGVHIFDGESLKALAAMPFELDLNLKPLLEGLENLDYLKALPEHLKLLQIPEAPDGKYQIEFDFEKYKEEGEAYLDTWSNKYRTEYGEAYEKEMRVWAESIKQEDLDAFEKEMEIWAKTFEKQIEEKFGKDFEIKMEAWGKDFEKQFEEKFGKDFEKRMELWGEEVGKTLEKEMGNLFEEDPESGVHILKGKSTLPGLFDNSKNQLNKIIKIKMPKKAKLKLNVRHGELQLMSGIQDIKANIEHGSLLANSIDGTQSSINLSYSELKVKDWKAAELFLNYVDKAQLASVDGIMLQAQSSNVNINSLSGTNLINGSFGDLSIYNISPTFNSINIVLENSEALLKLPKTDYTLFFNGSHSLFNNKNIGAKTIKNYPNNLANTTKSIIINAKFSEIIAQ